MNLLLWRHAHAEPGDPDRERPLSRKGERQAQEVAIWLRPRLPVGIHIVSSPALRARQTAAALELPFEVAAHFGPEATAAAVLAAVDWSTGADTLLIGHQPWLGQVAAFALSGEARDWSVRKGAVWWLWQKDAAPNGMQLRFVIDAETVSD